MRPADKGEKGNKHLPYLSGIGGLSRRPGLSPDSFVVRHQGSENPEEKGVDIMEEHLGSSQGKIMVIDNEMGSPVEPEQIRGGAYGHED